MSVAPIVAQSYQKLADFWSARRPRTTPALEALQRCRIVSHRGQHDNRHVFENTLAAFEQAATAGVWGLELDVQWTRDRVPVVHHDLSLERLWGNPVRLDELTHQELAQLVPAIPTLAEVVSRFGGQTHLMIELKHCTRLDIATQSRVLEAHLASLEAVRDYHLMSLTPVLLDRLAGIAPSALVAITDFWPDRLSRWTLQRSWGGLCCHYTLMRKSIVARHHAHRQSVGTGFAASRNGLFHEIHRGVDWIFSNHAVQLQAILDTACERRNVTDSF